MLLWVVLGLSDWMKKSDLRDQQHDIEHQKEGNFRGE
jgi:hypothetical protein